MKSTTSTMAARDGLRLALHEWAPEEREGVRACVVIVHGMVEHAARYARLGAALAGAGYAVYAPDLRGHGRTAVSRADIGHLENGDWERIVDDIAVLVSRARADHPGAPVILLGHSMGSLLARSYVLEHGDAIDALVLSGTPGDPGPLGRIGAGIAAAETLRHGARHRSTVLDNLTFGPYRKQFAPTRTDSDWLSRDAAEVDLYEADEACGGLVTSSFFSTLLAGSRGLENPARLDRIPKDLPILVLAGDKDPAADNGRAPRRIAKSYLRAGLTDVRLRLYPDARHEVFNETNRAEVIGELLDWLAERFPDHRV